jgi:hypothetical protein
LDGVLLDAEHGSAYFQGGPAEAEQYTADVASKLGALGKGVALSSHDQPRLFPGFPFSTFLAHVQDNCPQVYYTGDVATRLGRSMRDYWPLESARDFQDRYKPVGNITVRGDVALPSPAVCLRKAEEFMGLVATNGLKAYSFWCWDEAPDEIWRFFRDHPVSRRRGSRPSRSFLPPRAPARYPAWPPTCGRSARPRTTFVPNSSTVRRGTQGIQGPCGTQNCPGRLVRGSQKGAVVQRGGCKA